MLFKIFRNILRLIVLAAAGVALYSASRFALDFHPAVGLADSGYFGGSVKGRVFPGAADAGGLFFADGAGRLRFNLENLSQETARLALFVNGEQRYADAPIRPGVTKLDLPVPGGPAFVRFVWRSPAPAGPLVLVQRESAEYGRLRDALYIAGAAALVLLLIAFTRNSIVRPQPGRGHQEGREISAAVFVVFFAAFFWIHDRALIPLTGDEPHYMVLAQSMVQDGDYDVRDDYAGPFRQTYYPGRLLPHIVETAHGALTARYPGVAGLLAPAFAGPIAGLQIEPYTVAKSLMIACCASLALLFFLSLRASGASDLFAVCATGLLFASMPWLSYSNQIYPEVSGAMLLFVIFVRLIRVSEAGRRPDRMPAIAPIGNAAVHAAGTAALIALLPLLNLKFNAAAFFCGLALLWIYGRAAHANGARRPVFASGAVLCAGAIVAAAFAYGVYGDVLKGPYKDHNIVVRDFWSRYLTYLVDADRGLFALNPLLVCAFPGFALLFRKGRVLAICTALLIALTNLSGLFQREETHWLLGYCPAGRYWVSVLPILGWLAATGWLHLWRNARGGPRMALAVLVGTGALIACLQSLAFVDNQEAFYLPLKAPFNAARYFADISGIDLAFIFASHPFASWPPVVVWTALLIAIGGGLARMALRPFRETTESK